jgi:hypothetical protein
MIPRRRDLRRLKKEIKKNPNERETFLPRLFVIADRTREFIEVSVDIAEEFRDSHMQLCRMSFVPREISFLEHACMCIFLWDCYILENMHRDYESALGVLSGQLLDYAKEALRWPEYAIELFDRTMRIRSNEYKSLVKHKSFSQIDEEDLLKITNKILTHLKNDSEEDRKLYQIRIEVARKQAAKLASKYLSALGGTTSGR